tara:strand:+ start:1339 stop:1791 length:453 start_codon:yes stop_codon:yes gene_type:complete
MLEIYQRLSSSTGLDIYGEVELCHLQREKGRFKTAIFTGEEVGFFLERGNVLKVGDALISRCGRALLVTAKKEDVVRASTDDWSQFSKACYHLGNRHVKIQIGEKWLRILPDHVLEEMLIGLNMALKHEKAAFVPEQGAYKHVKNHERII